MYGRYVGHGRSFTDLREDHEILYGRVEKLIDRRLPSDWLAEPTCHKPYTHRPLRPSPHTVQTIFAFFRCLSHGKKQTGELVAAGSVIEVAEVRLMSLVLDFIGCADDSGYTAAE